MQLFNDDCLNILKTIPDESIDLVVTDCPYRIVSGGCTTNTFKSGGILDRDSSDNIKTGKLFDNNDIEFSEWLPDLYRVLKDGTHCYIMINARNLKDLQTECELVGFEFQNLLVWDKGNSVLNKWYMNAFELILMLRKGTAKNITDMGTSNILRTPNIIGRKFHPTEKPVELIKILVSNSSEPGEVILDPFMGSGSCGVACKELKRDFIGIEIDKKYFDIAKERIESTVMRKQKLF